MTAGGNQVFAALGAFAIRRRRWILAGWILLAVLASIGAGKAPQRLFSGSGDIAGSPSLRADSLWRAEFTNPYAQSLVVAFRGDLTRRGPEGGDSLAPLHADLERALRALPSVAAVMTPDNLLDKRLLPAPGKGSMVLVGLKASGVRDAEQAIPQVRKAADSVLAAWKARDGSLEWAVTGRAALTYDLNAFNAKDTAAAELRVIPLTLLILLFAFGSLVAAGVPVILGVVSTTVCMGIVYLLSGTFAFSNLVQNVSSMIGLAVGIDYSLFLIHRFREALPRHGGNREAALVEAMATAGEAVFLSGLTVMIGLGSLALTPLLETQSIGWGGCLVVLVAMALSLTFLPALLAALGPKLDWPAALSRRLLRPGAPGAGAAGSRRWEAWSRHVLARAPLAAVLGFALVLLLAWPGKHTRFGFPEGDFLPDELEFKRGHALLVDMGLEGLIAPVNVFLTTADGSPALDSARVARLHAFSARLRAEPAVARIIGPVDLADGWPLDKYRLLYADMDEAKESLPFVPDYFLSRDGKSLLMQVMLAPGTPLEAAKALARAVPGHLDAAAREVPAPGSYAVSVGGQAAYYNDFDRAMADTYPKTLGFVVAVTLAAMLLFFRSPAVSLKALLMNALSVLAGYGAVVWVFQLGNLHALFGTPGPTHVVPLTIPLMLFCIIFGLSMDYEVILLSRMREIFRATGDNERSVREGLAATGGMITSAALIMAAVFGAFAFARVVIVQMLGLGLAVAVLVDATVIRCLLVPALMKLAGRWNWWPGIRRRPEAAGDGGAGPTKSPALGTRNSQDP